jgi:hypothetical protein
MKNTSYVLLATALIMAGASCKKSTPSNNNNNNQTTSSLVRIQQGVDPDITNDSIYLLKYDTKKRLSVIIDSLNTDTLTATYNTSDQLVGIQESSPWSNDQLTATYNSSGQLTQIDCTVFGSHEQYAFTYSGSMPSQCVYSDDASGSLAVWRTYGYTVTGGNITDIKEYDKSSTFLGEHKMTYGSQANPFKTISLFNWGNRLGAGDIAFVETFFNTNMTATTTWYGNSANILYTTTQTTTNDKSGNPVKIVASEQVGSTVDGLYTWNLSYK